jgi:hypothetical protein
MLRTAGSPTADGKADLEGQQKADQRSLLPGLVYPLRERAQSREQRARRLIGKIRQRPGTFPLQPTPQAINFFVRGHWRCLTLACADRIGDPGIALSQRPRRPLSGILAGLLLRLRVDDGAEQDHEH